MPRPKRGRLSSAEARRLGFESRGDVYRVESLLAQRWNTELKRTELLIKWAGYPASQATWEPLENYVDSSINLDEKNEEQWKSLVARCTQKRTRGWNFKMRNEDGDAIVWANEQLEEESAPSEDPTEEPNPREPPPFKTVFWQPKLEHNAVLCGEFLFSLVDAKIRKMGDQSAWPLAYRGLPESTAEWATCLVARVQLPLKPGDRLIHAAPSPAFFARRFEDEYWMDLYVVPQLDGTWKAAVKLPAKWRRCCVLEDCANVAPPDAPACDEHADVIRCTLEVTHACFGYWWKEYAEWAPLPLEALRHRLGRDEGAPLMRVDVW